MKQLRNRLFATAALLAAATAPAGAAETINLTAVSGYPPIVAWTGQFSKFFIPEVEKRLGKTGKYTINWNEAYSGQIAKPGGEFEATQNGLADVGLLVVPLATDKVPAYAASFYTPFVTKDVVLASNITDAMAEKFPAMAAAWGDYNMVTLESLGVVDTYQIFSAKPIRTLGDLKGMKIAGIGPNLQWIAGLGAVGVTMNLATLYNTIQTGVAEAGIIHAGGAKNVKLFEVAPYMVQADLGSSVSFTVSINQQSWDRLPDEVKQAFREVAHIYADHTGHVGEQDSAQGVELWRKNGEILVIPQEERVRWAAAMPNVGKQWAADLTKRGMPGDAMLTYYMDQMRANNQPIARHWDRE